MLPRVQPPSYVACVAQILADAPSSLSINDLTDALKEHRPLNKGTRSAIYRALNKLYQAVPVGAGQYGWFSSLLRGNLFRHPLITEEARRGYLLMDELEHAVFFPQFFQAHRSDNRVLAIDLLGGPTVRAEAYIEHKTWSLRLGYDFVQWVDGEGGRGRDDILIRVDDAEAGRYTLRLQPREARDERTVRERNLELTQMAEELVHEDRRERKAMPTWELAARLTARGIFAHDVPPDDLHYVLHEHSLLQYQQGAGYMLEDRNPLATEDFHVNRVGDDLYSGSAYTHSQVRSNQRSSTSFFSYQRPPAELDELLDDSLDDSFEDAIRFGNGGQPLFTDSFSDDLAGEDLEWMPHSLDDNHPFDFSDDGCQFYQEYLENFYAAEGEGVPLSHPDYHLLEAELEMLVGLEAEFGYLIPEQEQRRQVLADRLFLDPAALFSDDPNELGYSDYPDDDEPPFWEN